MPNDVYQTPDADLYNDTQSDKRALASRWKRFFGSIIDSIILIIVILPIVFLVTYLLSLDENLLAVEESLLGTIMYDLLAGIAMIIIFFIINARLLFSRGKTIGKYFLGTSIVDMDSYNQPEQNVLIKRYCFYLILSAVPFIGSLLSFINAVVIFGEKKQCLHDSIARTVVVDDALPYSSAFANDDIGHSPSESTTHSADDVHNLPKEDKNATNG